MSRLKNPRDPDPDPDPISNDPTFFPGTSPAWVEARNIERDSTEYYICEVIY
jgi:hypothetical protein